MSSHIQSPNLGKDFESVELGELDKREEQQQQQQREKVPRRIIHFSSGETMEEYSTDEDEAEEKEAERKDLLSSPVDAVRVRKRWSDGEKGRKDRFVFAAEVSCWLYVLCVAVEADLGSVLLVPHVESRDVHHLRFVHRHDYIQPEGNHEAVLQVISCENHQNFS